MRKAILLAASILALGGASQALAQSAAPSPAAREQFNARVSFEPPATHAAAAYDPSGKHIFFKAQVAGREVWALLDTGAAKTLVDLDLARAAGLKVGPAEGVLTLITGTTIPRHRVHDIELGVPRQFTIRSELATGADLKPISTAFKREIGLILGADLLAGFGVKIDPGRGVLDFYPSGALTPPASFPPFLPLDKDFTIEILVADQPMRVKFDLGSDSALMLKPEAWARIAPPDAKLVMATMGGADGQPHVVDTGRAPSVKIGTMQYTDVKTNIMPLPDSGTDGTLGTGLLGQTLIVIDAKAGKLWLARRLSSTPAALR